MQFDLDVMPTAVSDAQADFVDDETTRHPAYVGGFGSGKTHAGVTKGLDLSLTNRGATGLMVEPTYRMIADILWPMVFDKMLDPSGVPYEWHKSDKTIKFPWGSKIIFRTGENPHRIAGFECSWAYLDEAPLVPELVWIQMGRRLREPGNYFYQLYTTFTCEVYAWTHGLWGREELLGEPLPDDYKVYHGSSRDNKHLPPGYVDSLLAGVDEELAIAVVEGHFTQIKKGRIYYTYDEKHNVSKLAEYDPKLPLELAFDFNQTPGNHVEVCQRHGSSLYVVDEVFRRGLVLEDACEEILDRYSNRQAANVIVYGDATGHRSASRKNDYDIILDILRNGTDNHKCFAFGVTLDVPMANPSVANSCATMRAALCDAKGKRRLYVNPACRRLRADLNGVQYASSFAEATGKSYTGDPHAIYKGDANLSHASDALRYWVHRVMPRRNAFERQTDYKISGV